MSMKKTAEAPLSSGSGGTVTLHNRLHPHHRYAAGLEQALAALLAELTGAWDISVAAVGRAWFRIDVVAPDGATWSTSVPVHEGPPPEMVAEMVRDACIRRHRLVLQRRGRRPASDTPQPASEGKAK